MNKNFTLGQRVTVNMPGTWLHNKPGTVVEVGRFADEMIQVRMDEAPVELSSVRGIDPRRVSPIV